LCNQLGKILGEEYRLMAGYGAVMIEMPDGF
jgi:hypothetical protein